MESNRKALGYMSVFFYNMVSGYSTWKEFSVFQRYIMRMCHRKIASVIIFLHKYAYKCNGRNALDLEIARIKGLCYIPTRQPTWGSAIVRDSYDCY
jgi:hypothetical protein